MEIAVLFVCEKHNEAMKPSLSTQFNSYQTNNNLHSILFYSIPFHSMALDLQLVESNRISAHNLGLILFAELGNVLLHDIHHLSIFTAQRHHYSSPALSCVPTRPIRSHHHAIHAERIENDVQIRREVLLLPIRPISFRHHARYLHKHVRKSRQILRLIQPQRLRECPAPTLR